MPLVTQDYRAVNSILRSLREIRDSLGLEDPHLSEKNKSDHVTKNFSKFYQLKYQVNLLLRDIRTNVTQCEKMKSKSKTNRNPDTIALIARNEEDILEAMQLAKQMASQWKLDKSAQKGKTELELENRALTLQYIGQELDALYQRNGRVEKQYVELQSVLPAPDQTVLNMQAQFRKNTREHIKKGAAPVEGEIKWSQGLTQEEREFAGHVEFIHHEQNKLLAEVGVGLRELKNMSTDMTKTIRYQKALAKDIGEEMQAVDQELDLSNRRLKKLMEETGGAGLWCTRIVCFVFLISLIMAFVSMLLGNNTATSDELQI